MDLLNFGKISGREGKIRNKGMTILDILGLVCYCLSKEFSFWTT